MDYIVQFQLNIYALITLLILFLIIKVRSEIVSFGKQIMLYTVLLTALAIFIDPLTWIFDGKVFFGSYFLEYSTNFMLLLLGPMIGGLMLTYVDYTMFGDRNRVLKKYYYMHATALTLLLLIINAFYPIYFGVDTTTNQYTLGDYSWIHYIIIFIMYLYMSIYTVINRKRARSHAVRIFLLFFFLPLIGMMIQLYDSHLNFSWTFIVLSILVIYVFLESTSGERDYLTKLFTRQSYEQFIKVLMETDKQFSIIYFDLDQFKQINDTNGHVVGDQILVQFGKYLNKCFSSSHIIARLGGDEYMIVVPENYDVEASIQETCNILKQSSNDLLRTLKFSYGVQSYTAGMTIDELYSSVDKKMYQYKQENRNLRRRKTD